MRASRLIVVGACIAVGAGAGISRPAAGAQACENDACNTMYGSCQDSDVPYNCDKVGNDCKSTKC